MPNNDWDILSNFAHTLVANGDGTYSIKTSGGGGGVVVGNPVSGAGTNEVLYVDGSGNIAVSTSLQYATTTGLVVEPSGNLTTALFYNPTATTGKTMVTIRAGAGNSNSDMTQPVLSIHNSSDTQVAAIRADGLIASSIIGTIDNINAALIDSSQSSSTDPAGLDLGYQASISWGSNQWWSTKDIGLSRISSGILGVGNGQQGDVTGILKGTSLIFSKLYPTADSTIAFGIFKADGSTNVLNADTTNGRVGIGTTSPQALLHLQASGVSGVTTQITQSGQGQGASDLSQWKDINGNLLFNMTPNGVLWTRTGSGLAKVGIDGVNSRVVLSSDTLVKWRNGTDATTGTIDIALARASAGILEVDNGTAGTLAGLAVGTLTTTGNVGIGTTSPTAVLHLKAGTATASTAPIKLTSGVLLTSPEAGALEFVTDTLSFTITTGTARKTIAFLESPSFTTPALGTVASGVISACTSTSMVMVTPVLGTPTSGILTNCTGLPAASVVAGTLGSGAFTANNYIDANNAITASGNAATVPITYKLNTVTNNSAATLTITMTTTSAVDGALHIVRILDASAVAQTITWVNTENSTVTAPTTSNGSTTLPLTVGFMFNNATTKWRTVASA